MNMKLITAVLLAMTGSAYAADFSALQGMKASDLAKMESVSAPLPVVEISVAERGNAGLKPAVLRISAYSEKELAGKFLNAKELEDLTRQLSFISGLPAKDIPAELLGYLEGISVSLQVQLPKGPVGRNIGPAMKAARALQAKVTSIRMPDKALRFGTEFAVGRVSIKIEPANFTLASVTASLACRFEDGSGSVGSRPEQELAVGLTPSERAWQADISAGKLSKFTLFSSPKSCQYALNVRSAAGVSGTVTLAGSMFNMTREELNGLLSNSRLNELISNQNQPLRLMERNGFIVPVK